MHFGALRSDQERLEKANYYNQRLDSSPTQPEHANWVMRPRDRSQEIGPEFRFAPHI